MENMNLVKIDTFAVVNETTLAVKENEGTTVDIRVKFPNLSVGYSTKKIPILKDIWENKFIQEEYKKEQNEISILQIEVISENNGSQYYYDTVRNIWYFAGKTDSLKEVRERREEFAVKYSQAEKKFKKVQMFKVFFIILLVLMLATVLAIDIDRIYVFTSFISGIPCILLLSLDLALSRIRFENGGFTHYMR